MQSYIWSIEPEHYQLKFDVRRYLTYPALVKMAIQ